MTATQSYTCTGCRKPLDRCTCTHPPGFYTLDPVVPGPNGQRIQVPIFGDTIYDDTYNADIVDAVWTPLIDWPTFWAQDHSAEEWIAWPLIPAKRQVALFAPAKSGKSWVTLAVCVGVATGGDILGLRNTTGPRHVLYLDYEMAEADLHERLETLGLGPDTDLTHLHYALLPSLPPLNTDQGCIALCGLAAAVEAEVVVIDTMGRAVQGEENSSDSYREFARTTGLALKAAGRAVLRTDHAGKDRDRGQRGSSAKNDDVDVVLRIDLVEGGCMITRTHSRIAWIPERVVITRNETADGTVTLDADPAARVYAEGTRELVATLRTLGITHESTRRQASEALTAAGNGARTKRVNDALRWMREELPTFPKQAGNQSGNQDFGHSREPMSEPLDSDAVTSGNHAGNHTEPRGDTNGNQGPPPKGGPVPSVDLEPDPLDGLF